LRLGCHLSAISDHCGTAKHLSMNGTPPAFMARHVAVHSIITKHYDRADGPTCGYDATNINGDDERRNAGHIDSGDSNSHYIDSTGSNDHNRVDGNNDNCNLHTGPRRNTRSRMVDRNSRDHNRTHHSIRRNTAPLAAAARFQALAQSRPSPNHHNGRHANRHANRRASAERLPRPSTLPMIQAVRRPQQSLPIISETSYARRPPVLECCFVLRKSQYEKPLRKNVCRLRSCAPVHESLWFPTMNFPPRQILLL
jgi:hypothetical protein